MPSGNWPDIYDLVGELRSRSGLSFEAVRESMGRYLGIYEYDRSNFDNRFRRRRRHPRYQLDELLALVSAFTEGLNEEQRCTAYEACQLFDLANQRLGDFERLRAFFSEAEFEDAWLRFGKEHGFGPTEPPLEVNQGHVFISYSQSDRATANKLHEKVTQAGHIVWQDFKKITAGSKWMGAIEGGIEECDVFVVILSARAVASHWVREEILYALRSSKSIIPFCIDATPLPLGLQQLNCVNAYPNVEAGFTKLLEALALHGRTAVSAQKTRRELELDYLDQVLLEHGLWQMLYTPMAGESFALLVQERSESNEALNALAESLEGFDEVVNEAFGETQVRNYPQDILDALNDGEQQFVILGESGSGKTTTLRRLAADLAEKAVESASEPLPVLVEIGKLEKGQSLEDHIRDRLHTIAPWYDELYQEGHLALLLDGLNEIPPSVRESLLNDIRAYVLAAHSTDHLLAITCRASDYGQDVDTGISRRFIINPLDPIRIQHFIAAYVQQSDDKRDNLFWTLAGDEARRYWDRFVEEVGDYPEIFWLNHQLPPELSWGYGGAVTRYFYWDQWRTIRSRPNSLLHLARNPYMLSMMTHIFITQHQIPNNRAKLFGAFMNYVLIHREGLSAVEATDLIRQLGSLAFAMQHSDDPASASTEIVLQYLKSDAQVRIAQGANILESGHTVRFTHQMLQHYFAAVKLDSAIEDGAAVSDYWPLDSWWLPNAWDETVILLAGLHASDTSPVITWMQDTAPDTAARCITESGGSTPESLCQVLAARWVKRLGENPVAARAAVGRALGTIGLDPRPGVGLTSDGLPDLDWVEIPGGKFIYGDGEQQQIASFAVSRYPITYLQFQAFIEAEDGFQDLACWEHLGRQEVAPGVQGFGYCNHPRERVSWYDAMAFCHWLSKRTGYQIRLPDEYQWEKAARGPDGLIYPYSNEFHAHRGNTKLTGLGQTSAVGIFAEGASPYGVLDMSGNVFEWCLNLDTGPNHIDLSSPLKRSLRGGSWAHSDEHARTDYRYANRPELRRNRVGFRPVRLL